MKLLAVVLSVLLVVDGRRIKRRPNASIRRLMKRLSGCDHKINKNYYPALWKKCHTMVRRGEPDFDICDDNAQYAYRVQQNGSGDSFTTCRKYIMP